MQSLNSSKILVVTQGREDPSKIHALFPDNAAGKDILLARSLMGALEMARTARPEVCILSQDMVAVQGQCIPDAIKEACPGIEIFIAEEEELGMPGPESKATSSH